MTTLQSRMTKYEWQARQDAAGKHFQLRHGDLVEIQTTRRKGGWFYGEVKGIYNKTVRVSYWHGGTRLFPYSEVANAWPAK